jgi:hypothetical protein
MPRDETCQKCNRWKGIEHTSRYGTYRDRAALGDRIHKQRFTDNPELLRSIPGVHSIPRKAA